MTDVLFLSSVQGYQASRVDEVAERLRKERPDLAVKVASPEETAPLLPKFKLKFGPAVVINNRLEFIGVPRYRMLLERIGISEDRAKHPPPPPATAAPAAPAKPAAAPAPAAPTTPPPEPAKPS